MSVWRRQRANLALCVVALGLIGVTVWDRGRISTDEALDRQHQLFGAWRVDDIGRVDIQYGARNLQLEVERDEDGQRTWSMREGEQLQEVDEQSVNAYLQTLEYAAQERMVSESDRAALGLVEPRMTVTVHMGALRYTLRVGGEAPSPAGGAYVEVEDADSTERYVVEAPLWQALTSGLGELRSKRLVPYLSTELQSLALKGDRAGWTLERGGWGGRTAASFLLKRSGHPNVRVSRRALDGWLTELGNSDVERFVALPAKPAAGSYRLTLKPLSSDKPSAVLEVGGACPDGDEGTLLVRREPLPAAGCIAEALAGRLLIDGAKLVDDYVLGSADGDIVELALDDVGSDAADIEVARKDEGWHMRKPNEGEVAPEPMANWLSRLIEAKGERLTGDAASDLSALGLDPPATRLQIIALPERGVAEAEQRVEKLDVSGAREGFVYLKRLDDGVVLRLAEDVGSAFVPRASTLRPTALVDIPREQVAAMRVKCGKPEQRLTRDARGAWTFEAPRNTGLAADVGLANELADQLRTLNALSWAADQPSAVHGLDKPWCTLALARQQSGEVQWMKVLVGSETRGGYFAQLEGEQAVFVLPRAVASRAGAWLFDRAALLVDFNKVEGVTLSAGDKQMSLSKQGERWLVVDNPSSQLGIQVGRTLQQLLAESVVHLGAARVEDGTATPRLRIAYRLTGEDEPLVLRVGKVTTLNERNVALVRRDDVEATMAVSRARLAPLFDAL